MRYVELMAERPLIWTLFVAYLAITSWLAWLGHRKTTDIASFAIGRGDMSPWVVGITLSASISSTATFVINPGFVYVHGVSALVHMAGATGIGVTLGLFVMSPGFRKIGSKHGALTLPQWIGQRYGSRAMTVFFAAINLLSMFFVVLILGGLSIVMQQTLGLTNLESLILITVFVFGYVFIGGTYAHAYTNTLQGAIMVVISLIIIISGFHLLTGGMGDALTAQDPNLVETINPQSPLYGSFFSVYVSGMVIGFALVCQPHILTKALYVKDNRAVYKYLGVMLVVSTIFSSLLLVGLYARVADIPPQAFIDPETGVFRQDNVMTGYIVSTFSPTLIAIITVALMAAGMSTLDGILVALSSIAANDLFLNIADNNLLKDASDDDKARVAHRVGQIILIAMGVIAFAIALYPPKLLGIFGQVGVYGIVAASTVPILFGILFPALQRRAAFVAAISGTITHFGLYLWAQSATDRGIDLVAVVDGWGPLSLLFDTNAPQLGFMNPGVTATYGIFVSLAVVVPVLIHAKVRARQARAAT